MGSFITTLKDDTKTNDLIPRTRLKCIADENGNYIDTAVTASDINSIANRLMKYSADSSQWDTTPTNGSTTRVTAGFSRYDGEFRLPLVLAQASPIFHSSCEGKLGIALE